MLNSIPRSRLAVSYWIDGTTIITICFVSGTLVSGVFPIAFDTSACADRRRNTPTQSFYLHDKAPRTIETSEYRNMNHHLSLTRVNVSIQTGLLDCDLGCTQHRRYISNMSFSRDFCHLFLGVNLPRSQDDAAITSAVVAPGEKLDLRTILRGDRHGDH